MIGAMPTYAIIAETDFEPEALARLVQRYPDRFKVSASVVLVRSKDLSRDVAMAVFDFDEKRTPNCRHIVTQIGAWWGFNDRSLWEWLSRAEVD